MRVLAQIPRISSRTARCTCASARAPVTSPVFSRHFPTTRSQPFVNTPRSFSSSSRAHHHGSQNNSKRYLPWWEAAVLGSAGVLALSLTSRPLLAEEARDKQGSNSKALFSKEQVGVICIVGGPSSGKTTQLQKIVKRFDLTEVKGADLKSSISDIVKQGGGDGKRKPRVVMEGFPTSLNQADKFEAEVVPILLIIFIDLEDPSPAINERIEKDVDKRDAKINWRRFKESSEGLIKEYRYRGNILEITGKWPEDEVWEQVEAKLESALELDDRGEL